MAGRALVEIDEAVQMIVAAVDRLPSEPVELAAALGRVLADDVLAREAVPAFDNSAMDGFAVRSDDVSGASPGAPAVLAITGESRAGSPATAHLAGGQAIVISTGAMLPAGADSIVRLEDARRRDGVVEILAGAARGENVRSAGDDIVPGRRVLERGTLIGPAELGVLASLGLGTVRCSRRPRLSLLTTGDELLDPGEPMRPGGVRNSNAYAVRAQALQAGALVVSDSTVGDDGDATRAAIADALADVDVLVVCGGVSVGRHDHVRTSLAGLGVRERFWGIALKPGRPTYFGTTPSTLVFGLPGNPVSAMVTFALLVEPALCALAGMPAPRPRASAVLERAYQKEPGRAHALRCTLRACEDGWHATPTGPHGSHVLTSMLGADALAMIPTDATSVAAGERVEIELLATGRGQLSQAPSATAGPRDR